MCKTKGKISSRCNMCKGSGEILQTIPENPAPLQNNLIGTAHYHRTKKLTPLPPKKIRKKCPKCGGSGSITITCPECGGSGTFIDDDNIDNLYKKSITATLALSENLLFVKRIVHKAAAAQQASKVTYIAVNQGMLTPYTSEFDRSAISTNAAVNEIDGCRVAESPVNDIYP